MLAKSPEAVMKRRPLTQCQTQVINLLRLGLSDREISEQLGISVSGVRRRLEGLKKKIGLRTKFQIVAWAFRAETGRNDSIAKSRRRARVRP
jgi:DNA-binding NarL/FixJ family response regulator